MSTLFVASRQRVSPDTRGGSSSSSTLAAAVLGFLVITLDAVVVNVALPSIRRDLGGAASVGAEASNALKKGAGTR